MNPPRVLSIIDSDIRLCSSLSDKSIQDGIPILYQADVEAGIISYDISRIDYYLLHSDNGQLCFCLQWNELRSLRPKNPTIQSDCPVDLQLIIQKNWQHWLTFALNERLMVVLGNPFGYMPMGMTIASAEHESQFWRTADTIETRHRIRRTARDLYTLAVALPSFVVIYNGAGASLPNHNHYQTFQLPNGHGLLGIQQAAGKKLTCGHSTVVPLGFEGDYPVIAFRIAGDEDFIVNSVASFIETWEGIQGEAATANLIALTEDDEVCVYFIPRNSLFQKGVGFAGSIASLELCGSFVCSAQWELQAVREGRFSYKHLWRVLEAVRPHAAYRLC